MDVDWTRYILNAGLIVVIYYVLLHFSPLARMSRERQFLFFGAVMFLALTLFNLLWP